jgi:hypothetical protein
MSATLGDVTQIADDLTRRTGRETALVTEAERPVPLDFSWSLTPLPETVEELVGTHQAPVYVVHFTQKDAVEHAQSLLGTKLPVPDGLKERLHGVRFTAGFGKTLSKLLKAGIGVHHAGMLPRYRRLVEQLAQAGLLTVICGTDTLGVGINVPIRTVLFTALAKYDGRRQRVLRTREFLQIAGRAGRAGYDTAGYVVVQAPEHTIENERAKAKSDAKNAANPKKKSKPHLKKPPEGTVVWTEATFDKLVAGVPEPLVSRMRVDDSMILNVVAREEDAFPVLRRLLTDNHSDEREQRRLARRALRLARSLVESGILTRLEEPDRFGRRYVLTTELPEDFALNQELAHFALAALDVLDPEAPTYTMDIVSVIEAVLEAPRPVLFAQQHEARGEAIASLKADGVEYDERMALIEDVTWPQPLAELLEATFELYRGTHPWLDPEALQPKQVVREMWEQGMGFTDLVARYAIARSEGLVLRYLTDAYRTLRVTVPERHRTPELELLVEWLGETIRQTDSSLLDEWEALADPASARPGVADAPPPPPRPISAQERPFRVMVRNAMWRRVELAARDDVPALALLEDTTAALVEPSPEVAMTHSDWDAALEGYYADHDEVLLDADARGPSLLATTVEGRLWHVRQTVHDPEGDHDWVVEATVHLDASDVAGEAVVLTTALRRLDGV